MLIYGGDLEKHNSFTHILSIGYEFETHDLAKLSLNDDILINSSIIFMMLKNKLLRGMAKKIDKNSYEIEDGGKKYIEYYDENIEGDIDNVMNITNDIGGSNFDKMLSKKCKTTKDKNNIYSFETDIGKKYKIHFDSSLQQSKCSIFSGPEFVITYYKIQQSKNIILETFLNACYRIFTHLNKLEKITGNLVIKDENGSNDKIGNLKNRILFHKPNTNLYYLQTHDSAIFSKDYSIGAIGIMPQMTFRANIIHVVQIIKDILYNYRFENSKQNKKMIMKEYEIVDDIDKCIGELLDNYNKHQALSKWKLNPKDRIVKEIIGYLFMIFYKIYMYVEFYINSSGEENYFKNYLSFASRHMNYIFYKKIKGLLYTYFEKNWDDKIETEDINSDLVYIIISLIDKPEIIQQYMYFGRKKKILTIKLSVDDENYGDPAYSFISYFHHFEHPSESNNEDNTDEQQREWFIDSEIDVSSTNFEIPQDSSIIIENRLFFYEITTYMKDEVKLNAPNYFTLNNLKTIYLKLVEKGKKVVDLNKKELNPKTDKFVNKCENGKERNSEFRCVTKKAKKEARKTKKARTTKNKRIR